MRVSIKLGKLVMAGVLLAGMAVVSGCREEEQGRILSYEKGTYLGKADQDISEATRQELKARARSQSF